ncbi:TetR/AcrR family transcriptional regulator C-terminal ligand-binding domain-containing protein [Streptomyces sp. NPDC001450]
MNGEPLLARHVFPLRAVAPRMFGTKSVRWLTRIHLSDTRPDHLFTTRLYNRTPPSEDAPSPVREVARGEVRPDVDIRSAATLVAAPLVYRLLAERELPDSRFVEDLVDLVVRAVGHPGT